MVVWFVIEIPHGVPERTLLKLGEKRSNLRLSALEAGINRYRGLSVHRSPTGAICCFQAGETSNSLRQTRRQVHYARRQPRRVQPVGVSCFWGLIFTLAGSRSSATLAAWTPIKPLLL